MILVPWDHLQVPRECWEACALLLDKAPVSLAVAVLSKISKKYLKAEVLMTLPVRTQASVLREMQERNSNLNFKDILSVMDNPDIVELCASFAQIEESRILGILILETCYALDRLEAIGSTSRQVGWSWAVGACLFRCVQRLLLGFIEIYAKFNQFYIL